MMHAARCTLHAARCKLQTANCKLQTIANRSTSTGLLRTSLFQYSIIPLFQYSSIPVFQYSSIPVLVAERSVGFPNVGLSEPEFA
jgi:hypothetical protein